MDVYEQNESEGKFRERARIRKEWLKALERAEAREERGLVITAEWLRRELDRIVG